MNAVRGVDRAYNENTAFAAMPRFKQLNRFMAPQQAVEEMLDRLTPGKKAGLLQRVARDLGDAYPGIDRTSGVCGGDACIARTRIPVWLLVQAHRMGTTEAQLLDNFPSLKAADLANAWAYAHAHVAEIERQISANEAA